MFKFLCAVLSLLGIKDVDRDGKCKYYQYDMDVLTFHMI